MTRKVLISATPFSEFSPEPLDRIRKAGFVPVISQYGCYATPEQSLELLQGVSGLIAGIESLPASVLEKAKELKVISRVGIGLDNIDLQCAKRRNIAVRNTPDAPTDAVAELTLAVILSLLRQVVKSNLQIRKGEWVQNPGSLLRGKTVALLGLGRIGRRLVELLEPFRAKIIAQDIAPEKQFLEKHQVKHFNSLAEMLPEADVVSLHIPYTVKSHYIVGRPELSQMKKSAILVNCSRGGLIDEAALYCALKAGSISGAALDAFEFEPYCGPLSQLENVILTPHIGSYARESRIRMEMEAVDNLIAFLGPLSKA